MAQLHTPTPDGVTLCVLCHTRQETFSHLFFECPTTYPMWEYIYHLTQRITGLRLNPCFELSVQFNFPNHASQYTDLLILLYTVTRHTNWKSRNTARLKIKPLILTKSYKESNKHSGTDTLVKTAKLNQYTKVLCAEYVQHFDERNYGRNMEVQLNLKLRAILSCEIPTFSIERANLQFSATRSSTM